MATVPTTRGLNITQHLYQLNRILDQATFAAIEGPESVGSDEEITQQIALTHQILSKTRFLQNSKRPVNRLPFELLSAIFLQVQHHEPWTCFPPSSSRDMRGIYRWLSVTAVCIHWRRVALAEPSLWGRICLRYKRQAMRDLMLERAQKHPISLHHELHPSHPDGPPDPDGIVAFIAQCSTQLKFLCLERNFCTEPSDPPSDFWKIFDYPFPLIEEVHLDLQFHHPEPVSTSIQRMLQSSQQTIRRLSLCYVAWPMFDSNLPHLTHLLLDYPTQGPESAGVAFSVLLDALQNSPQLEYLSICDAVPIPAHSNIHTARRIIRLPCLRKIEISWSTAPVDRISRLLLHHLVPMGDVEVLLYVRTDSAFSHQPLEGNLEFLGRVVDYLSLGSHYLDRVSTLQLCPSLNPAVLLRGKSLCFQSLAIYGHLQENLQRFTALIPNARTLIFDVRLADDTRDILVFRTSHFSTFHFLHSFIFSNLVEALTHPMVHTAFPSPPNEIYLRATWSQLVKYVRSHSSDRIALDRAKEVCVVDRSHLNQPPLKLYFGHVATGMQRPFSGSLDGMLRDH